MFSLKLHTCAVIALISSVFIVIPGCTDTTGHEITPVRELLTVEVQQAIKSDSYSVTREYVGSIHANQKANLGFELPGKVSRIHVDVGEKVVKGQALIALDTQLLVTERKQLEAQLNEINAQLRLTKTNLQRQHSLRVKGFSSEADLDALNTQKEILLANILRTKSSISAIRLKEQKSIIIAPYSGIISERFVSLGDVLSAGAPTFSLLSSGNKEAVIGVYKGDVKNILEQEQYKVRIEENHLDAMLISSPSNIELNSRNVRLRFRLEEGLNVLDGELAYLSYQKVVSEKGFWLPNTALTDGIRGTWNVYVLKALGEKQVVESRSVQVLHSDSKRVYVQGALSAGEDVVVSGLHKVVPGQAVKTAYLR